MKKVVLDLPPEQGHALAQFVKRTGFDDCQRLGSRHDGGVEAEEMWAAIQKLQSALKDSGFNPRFRREGRPSSGGRLFFTVRHAIHTDMHTRLSTTLRPLEGRTSLGK